MIWLLFETRFGDRVCALVESKLNLALVSTVRWPGVRLVPVSVIQ